MSGFILLDRMCIQNANAISGLIYGFPAITHFLGFGHALSRRLPADFNITFSDVAVVCHQHQVHAKQPKGWGDYVFALTRNPLTKEGQTAPIIEEGRMSLTVSLLLKIEGVFGADDKDTNELEYWLMQALPAMRLAGGQIINQPKARYVYAEDEKSHAMLMRSLMPGYVLIDRRDYLQAHYEHCITVEPTITLLDAWCDFITLKYKAEVDISDDKNHSDGGTKKDLAWRYVPKPQSGYLVPIMAGYCALSDEHPPGTVQATRDASVPAVFAEAAYSIGEWISPHRIHTLQDCLWRYHYSHPWYVAITDIKQVKHTNNSEHFDTY